MRKHGVGRNVLLAAAAGLAISSAAQAQFIIGPGSGTFTDISGTGTALAFTNVDDGTAAFTSSVTNALVTSPNLFACTNGNITNSATFTGFTNTTLPGAGITFGLFPYWDDLYVNPPGAVYVQSVVEGGINVQIIQWNAVMLYPCCTNPVGTFEVKIFGSGPVLAQFIYQDVAYTGSAQGNGASATIGAQWGAAAFAQYGFNTPNAVQNGTVLSILADTATGACCLPTGACTPNITAAACTTAGGVFQGANTQCGTCPQPGACCLFSGSCSVVLPAACTAQGGTFQGAGTQCGTCPSAPPVIYSNCNIATGTTTLSGMGGLPAGTQWSECARDETDPTTSNTVAGFTGSGTFRLADDFVVPAGGMNLAYVRAYAYVSGATTPNATAANIQIWNGPPNAGGTVIFGDTTTNRLANNSFAPIYRCFNTVAAPACGGAVTVADQNRHLQYLYLTVNQFLPAGTYWIDINYTGPSFSPPSVQADAIGRQCDPNNANALQSNGGVWGPLADAGQGCAPVAVNQDLFFDLLGTPGTPACYANCDGSTTPPILNVLDFGCFLNKFASGDTYANCDGSTTPPVLNVLDFGCFLNRFAAGCT